MKYKIVKCDAGFSVMRKGVRTEKAKKPGEEFWAPVAYGGLESCAKRMLELCVADELGDEADGARLTLAAVQSALSTVSEVVRAVSS